AAIQNGKIYSQMNWQFFYSKTSSFLTSDNPLIYYEPKIDTGPYGYGIATPTVEKIVPLSSNLILWIGDLGNKILYRELNDKKVIRYINSSIFVRRHQFVIAKDKELLEFLSKRTKDYKRPINIKVN
ncbi:MAG: DUF4238 domain-containing protein, partial [Candidatus Gastranaerophilales bacterium]|nr:DUF4238 domain-containing protein [Candidatus Gastranaerophilales bacterium]